MGNVFAPAVAYVMEDEEIAEGRRVAMLKRQHLRDISNPFEVSEEQFRKYYRMTQNLSIELIEMLLPFLPIHPRGVPPHQQVLSTLRFLASGEYQAGLGHDYNHPASQSTVSKYLHIVISAINQLADEFIRFPRTEEERELVSNRFQESLGFPGALALLDCTLIGIHTPSEHEEAYLDHHQDHSLNCQVAVDFDYNICNLRIVNGSTHDAFNWRFSELREEMLTLRRDHLNGLVPRNYFIVADSGYTQAPYLMVPINQADEDTPEYHYSVAVRGTRCRVEQTFGIWKEIMRCINSERILHYEPVFAAEIIRASAVIYNFMRRRGMRFPVPQRVNNRRNNLVNVALEEDDYATGLEVRQRIINEYFN